MSGSNSETRFEKITQDNYPPQSNSDSQQTTEWDSLKNVPFAGQDNYGGTGAENSADWDSLKSVPFAGDKANAESSVVYSTYDTETVEKAVDSLNAMGEEYESAEQEINTEQYPDGEVDLTAPENKSFGYYKIPHNDETAESFLKNIKHSEQSSDSSVSSAVSMDNGMSY